MLVKSLREARWGMLACMCELKAAVSFRSSARLAIDPITKHRTFQEQSELSGNPVPDMLHAVT
jgi:hypothetical protein